MVIPLQVKLTQITPFTMYTMQKQQTQLIGILISGRVIVGRVIVGRVIVGRVIVGRVIVGRVIVGRVIVHGEGEWIPKMMAVFFFIAHEKGFKFHAEPQTGAYSCYSF